MAETDTATEGLPVLLTVPEACKVLRSSRTVVYPLLSSGELPSVKSGRRRLIRREDLLSYIANMTPDPSPSSGWTPPEKRKSRKAA